jgi:hypothetical protein
MLYCAGDKIRNSFLFEHILYYGKKFAYLNTKNLPPTMCRRGIHEGELPFEATFDILPVRSRAFGSKRDGVITNSHSSGNEHLYKNTLSHASGCEHLYENILETPFGNEHSYEYVLEAPFGSKHSYKNSLADRLDGV